MCGHKSKKPNQIVSQSIRLIIDVVKALKVLVIFGSGGRRHFG